MKQQRKIYSKEDRILLHGILSGRAANTNGVPVQFFQSKIQKRLPAEASLKTSQINQIMFGKYNNQFVWQAAYEVAEEERPGLFDELSKQAEAMEA